MPVASTSSSTPPPCSTPRPIVEISRQSFDQLFAINVAGALFTLQAAAKVMVRQGRGGKIINMASQAGRRGEALVAVYCATKAAIISLTQSAGLDLIRYRINVNAIAPGVVDGEHWDGVDALFARYEQRPLGEKKKLVGEAVPYGRMGRPEDLTGNGRLPRLAGSRLHRRPDLQCGRRQLDELTRPAWGASGVGGGAGRGAHDQFDRQHLLQLLGRCAGDQRQETSRRLARPPGGSANRSSSAAGRSGRPGPTADRRHGR